MKKQILFSLILISFFGYSQENYNTHLKSSALDSLFSINKTLFTTNPSLNVIKENFGNLVIMDVDQDNKKEILYYNSSKRQIVIHQTNNGIITDTKQFNIPFNESFTFLPMIDINKNGKPEIGYIYENNLCTFFEYLDNNFYQYSINAIPRPYQFIDIDNDCDYDFMNDVFYTHGKPFLNKSTSSGYKEFNTSIEFLGRYLNLSNYLDINKDGYWDILNPKSARNRIFKNSGSGQFSPYYTFENDLGMSRFLQSIDYADQIDVNSDNKFDLVFAEMQILAGTYSIAWIDNFTGNSEIKIIHRSGGNLLENYFIADFNGDSYQDIIVYNKQPKIGNKTINGTCYKFDWDQDGDEDILTNTSFYVYSYHPDSGFRESFQFKPDNEGIVLLTNNSKQGNLMPGYPTDINIQIYQDQAKVQWSKTDKSNLYTDIKIGSTPNGSDIKPHSYSFNKTSLVYGDNAIYRGFLKGDYYVSLRNYNLSGQSSNWSEPLKISITETDNTSPQEVNSVGFEVYQPYGQNNLKSASNGCAAILYWKNPMDNDFWSVKVLKKENGFPENVNDGELIYFGSADSFIDSFLIVNKEYYYSIFAIDEAGNGSSISDQSQIKLKAFNEYAPKITHIPVKHKNLSTLNDSILIYCFIDEDIKLTKAGVYYKNSNEVEYNYKALQDSGRIFKTYISPTINTDGKYSDMEYYIEANDGFNNTCHPATGAQSPNTITLSCEKQKHISGRIIDLLTERPLMAKVSAVLNDTIIATNTDDQGFYQLYFNNKFGFNNDSIMIESLVPEYYSYKHSIKHLIDFYNGNFFLTLVNTESQSNIDFLDVYERYPNYYNWSFNDLPIKICIDTTSFGFNNINCLLDTTKSFIREWEDNTNLKLFQFTNRFDYNTVDYNNTYFMSVNGVAGAGRNSLGMVSINYLTTIKLLKYDKNWRVIGDTLDIGSYNQTVVHEIGHVLGFSHPKNVDGIMSYQTKIRKISLQESLIIKHHYFWPEKKLPSGEIWRLIDEIPFLSPPNYAEIINHSPKFNYSAIGDTIWRYNNHVFTTFTATDEDHDQLIFSIPEGGVGKIDILTGEFSLKVDDYTGNNIELLVKVSDGMFSDTLRKEFVILDVPTITGNLQSAESIGFDIYKNGDETKCLISLDRGQKCSVNLYNIQGQMLQAIYNGHISKGTSTFNFKRNNLSSGVYIIELRTQDNRISKRIAY